MYYSADATETVISQTDIFSNQDIFDSWWQINNCKTGSGQLRFFKSNGISIFSVPLIMVNKLWYITQDTASNQYCSQVQECSEAFIKSVSGTTLHNLWHHRLCHAGQFVCDNIDKVVDGVPSLK